MLNRLLCAALLTLTLAPGVEGQRAVSAQASVTVPEILRATAVQAESLPDGVARVEVIVSANVSWELVAVPAADASPAGTPAPGVLTVVGADGVAREVTQDGVVVARGERGSGHRVAVRVSGGSGGGIAFQLHRR